MCCFNSVRQRGSVVSAGQCESVAVRVTGAMAAAVVHTQTRSQRVAVRDGRHGADVTHSICGLKYKLVGYEGESLTLKPETLKAL